METPSGAELRDGAREMVDALCGAGIEHLFCNLGTDHAPLIEEFARRHASGEPAPEVVVCPHENTAIHMAGGYALATGRVQAVLVHVDAGTANAAMGMHNLARLHLPVILVAGRAPYSSRNGLTGGRNAYVNFVQEPFDQASLVRPYVKWEYHLTSAAVAGEAVARAVERARATPKGPVYLTAARETLAEPAPQSPRFRPRPTAAPLHPAADAVIELADRLIAADDPLIITAYAGTDPRNVAVLDAIARLAAIRVIEFTPHAVNLPHESPCHGGFSPAPAVSRCDVGVLIDIDVPWIPALGEPRPESWWAHLDTDIEKPDFPLWPFPADLRSGADTHATLSALLDALHARTDGDFRRRAERRLAWLTDERRTRTERSDVAARVPGRPGQLDPASVCAALSACLTPDDIVVNEAVRNAPVVFEQVPRSRPGTRIGPAGGGLGYSAGLALGLALADQRTAARRRIVVNVVGDGVAYFSNLDATLAVACRHGLPTLTLVLDNGGWAAVKEATAKVYPAGKAKATGTWQAGLGRSVNFALLAQAAGAAGFSLAEPGTIGRLLAEAVAVARQGRPTLVHAQIADF